jgi:hypothetical protein
LGNFTIKEVLYLTNSSSFRSRLRTSGRDVNKTIRVQEVKTLSHGALNKPSIKYVITTKSWPQYPPYTKIKGKKSLKQRKVYHEYENVLELDRLSVNTKNWKARTGSEKLLKKPNQNLIKQIYNETSKRLQKKASKKFKSKKEQASYIKKEKEKIRKRGKYLSVGDYQSRYLGINQDFLYRQEYVYWMNGHLYNRNRTKYAPKEKSTNHKHIMFFNKHQIALIRVLLNRGILKND